VVWAALDELSTKSKRANEQRTMVPSPEVAMSDEPTPAPRHPRIPFKDRLGELCESGSESTVYLWQVPDDQTVRRKIAGILTEIKAEAAKGGRKEMGRLVEELETALAASATPQQVEILQDGFDRLTRLWAAAKSGLF
jgi:hypothetical protein